MIRTFTEGRYVRFSNYALCLIFYDGHAYGSVEHAYQAQKTLDPAIQKMIRDAPTPAAAKRIARSVRLRGDWEGIKLPLMKELLIAKFVQEPDRTLLLETGDQQLVEGNWWHDNFWGDCWCPRCKDVIGQNHLGKLLMGIRFHEIPSR